MMISQMMVHLAPPTSLKEDQWNKDSWYMVGDHYKGFGREDGGDVLMMSLVNHQHLR